MKFQFSHALSVHSLFPLSHSQGCHPPSRLARVFRFCFRLPFRFSLYFFRFFFPSPVFVPAGPFSPPFEKALVFFLLLVKRLVRLTQGMSECPTIALFFLSLIRIFLFSSSSLQPLVRLSLPNSLQNSRSFSKFKLYSSAFPPKSNVHENRVFSPSLLFLLSFSLSVLALFLSSFSVRLSVDIPGVH